MKQYIDKLIDNRINILLQDTECHLLTIQNMLKNKQMREQVSATRKNVKELYSKLQQDLHNLEATDNLNQKDK